MHTEESLTSSIARMSLSSDGTPITPQSLVDQLMELTEAACAEVAQPFEMVRRLMHDGGFDAYQAGVVTFLSMIGYLDHDDTTKATLDTHFLKAFRMDFARSIPYLHQAESSIASSC